jgi:RNA ligase
MIFPRITHINDVLVALTKADAEVDWLTKPSSADSSSEDLLINRSVIDKEWTVAERQGFIVINYEYVDYRSRCPTFPELTETMSDDERLRAMIRREARGIKFNRRTGRIIARPFHKFFNIGEKQETKAHNVDWSDDLRVLEKMDGSMIHPMRMNSDDEIILCSKMGHTSVALQAEAFVNDHQAEYRYKDFFHHMIDSGCTPLFEWCSRQQLIVIDYKEDMLVLIAIRDNENGGYHPYDQMVEVGAQYNIPVVKSYGSSIEDINQFVANTTSETEGEGYVVTFEDGRRYKIKNEHYLTIHRAKDKIGHETTVWTLVVEGNMDDAMAFMSEADRDRATRFSDALNHEMTMLVEKISRIVAEARTSIDAYCIEQGKEAELDSKALASFKKKEFVQKHVMQHDKNIHPPLFKVWEGLDPMTAVRGFVQSYLVNEEKLEQLRQLIKLDWNKF